MAFTKVKLKSHSQDKRSKTSKAGDKKMLKTNKFKANKKSEIEVSNLLASLETTNSKKNKRLGIK